MQLYLWQFRLRRICLNKTVHFFLAAKHTVPVQWCSNTRPSSFLTWKAKTGIKGLYKHTVLLKYFNIVQVKYLNSKISDD